MNSNLALGALHRKAQDRRATRRRTDARRATFVSALEEVLTFDTLRQAAANDRAINLRALRRWLIGDVRGGAAAGDRQCNHRENTQNMSAESIHVHKLHRGRGASDWV